MIRQVLAVLATKMLIAAMVAVLMTATGVAAQAAVTDLSYSATGFGFFPPTPPLDQGKPPGIADGSLFSWGGPADSPRYFSTPTTISPYETWATDQIISSVRIWEENFNVNYDSVTVSVLKTGGTATNDADWTPVAYSSGTGLNKNYLDVALDNTYTTKGLRVTATTTNPTGDISVGEVAAFGPQAGGGTLTSYRVTPTGASASSVTPGRDPSLGIDAVSGTDPNWLTSSLTLDAGSDTNLIGGKFHYDVSYAGAALDGLEISWGNNGGASSVPAHWTIQYEDGAGFHTIGTFDKRVDNVIEIGDVDSIMNYIDLDSITGKLAGVLSIRLLVDPADIPGGKLSVAEFEAFSIPEPASVGMLAVGSLLLLQRRRA